MDDRLHQGPGRRRAATGSGTSPTIPGDGGNWGGSYLSIPAASENKEAAFELIKWLTAPEQQVKMWTDGAALPVELDRGRGSGHRHQPPTATSATRRSARSSERRPTTSPIAILGPKDGVIKDTISNGLNRVDQQGQNPDEAWQQTMDEIAAAIG